MSYIEEMNNYARENIPFIFIISFDQSEFCVLPVSEASKNGVFFNINGNYNYSIKENQTKTDLIIKEIMPPDFTEYKDIFNKLHNEFVNGNTFLTNLTFRTEIDLELSPTDIFNISKAPYKLLYKDKFTLFSPETFIKTDQDFIYTYPMKGTINAEIENADEILLKDEKEFAEHITVVDLLRNDLGIVSEKVEVLKFRYIVPVFNKRSPLLQTVSEIKGKIKAEFKSNPGNLISALLPAGSISGAPKKKTVEIINSLENYKRGFYTGVFGIWKNGIIDSSVMIRFIEKDGDKFYYKSGGGITVYSNAESEYKELLEKIYVPVY